MLELKDKYPLFRIVAETISEAQLTCQDAERRNHWINAIAKATTVLEGDLTFVHWEQLEKLLFYWSKESDEIYKVSETDCQCPAFRQPVPLLCYHRAMHRIVSCYFTDESGPESPELLDLADAVFFDSELDARSKIELLTKSILEDRADLKPRVEALERLVEEKNRATAARG